MEIVFLSSTIWNKYVLTMFSLTKRNQLFIIIYAQQNYQTSFSFAENDICYVVMKPQFLTNNLQTSITFYQICELS